MNCQTYKNYHVLQYMRVEVETTGQAGLKYKKIPSRQEDLVEKGSVANCAHAKEGSHLRKKELFEEKRTKIMSCCR